MFKFPIDRKRLKLSSKFTIILGLIFLCGSLLSYGVLSHLQSQSAQRMVTEQSVTLINTLNALRDEYADNIRPLLKEELDTTPEFTPETVPSYVVRQVFESFREQEAFKDYLYKDAAPNPTNPRDQADEFETALVSTFEQNPDLVELHGFRELNDQSLYYVAHPLKLTNPNCLVCHSTPDVAPKNLIKTYGPERGFFWELDDIIATQIIYVPAQQVLWEAQRNTLITILIFMGIFGVTLLILNYLLKRLVLEPIRPMARVATQLSQPDLVSSSELVQAQDLVSLDRISGSGDELGQLARIFQRMARVIASREQDLLVQLQNSINQVEPSETKGGLSLDAVKRLILRSQQSRQTPPDSDAD
jgi:HAMP domain-containing protein